MKDSINAMGGSLIKLVQGIAIGAVATMLVGFSFGGWVTGGTARKTAERDAKYATIAALAPICVDKFENNADAATNLSTLKKISLWQQASFIEKGGWATMPGASEADMGVAQACAELLGHVKVVSEQ
jgi:pimeloyl-ACP methyl ester carboxylesterase